VLFAPTIGFAGLLRVLGRGSYSAPTVRGSSSEAEDSVGSGVSRAFSGACSVSLVLHHRTAIRESLGKASYVPSRL